MTYTPKTTKHCWKKLKKAQVMERHLTFLTGRPIVKMSQPPEVIYRLNGAFVGVQMETRAAPNIQEPS